MVWSGVRRGLEEPSCPLSVTGILVPAAAYSILHRIASSGTLLPHTRVLIWPFSRALSLPKEEDN